MQSPMRALVAILGCLSFSALSAPPAAASPFSGTLRLAVGLVTGSGGGWLGELSSAGIGAASVNDPLCCVTVTSAAFAPATASFPVKNAFALTNLRAKISKVGTGNFDASVLIGNLPVYGSLKLKAPVPPLGPHTLVEVPLGTAYVGFGRAGTAMGTTGTLAWVATHDLWHEGAATLATPFGTVMFTGSDTRTPNGVGQLTLVSPTKVTVSVTSSPPTSLLFVAAVGRLTIDFVPEPGTFVLLGAGVAGLGFMGRRRTRALRSKEPSSMGSSFSRSWWPPSSQARRRPSPS